jgi:hypothetical protein
MLKLKKKFDILFVHISILGAPSLDILRYFIGVLCRCHEKVGIYVGCMFGVGSCLRMCALGLWEFAY